MPLMNAAGASAGRAWSGSPRWGDEMRRYHAVGGSRSVEVFMESAECEGEPRRGQPWAGQSSPSLDVLHLLAHLLDDDLHVHRAAGGLQVLRLGGQRVGFAIELL